MIKSLKHKDLADERGACPDAEDLELKRDFQIGLQLHQQHLYLNFGGASPGIEFMLQITRPNIVVHTTLEINI